MTSTRNGPAAGLGHRLSIRNLLHLMLQRTDSLPRRSVGLQLLLQGADVRMVVRQALLALIEEQVHVRTDRRRHTGDGSFERLGHLPRCRRADDSARRSLRQLGQREPRSPRRRSR